MTSLVWTLLSNQWSFLDKFNCQCPHPIYCLSNNNHYNSNAIKSINIHNSWRQRLKKVFHQLLKNKNIFTYSIVITQRIFFYPIILNSLSYANQLYIVWYLNFCLWFMCRPIFVCGNESRLLACALWVKRGDQCSFPLLLQPAIERARKEGSISIPTTICTKASAKQSREDISKHYSFLFLSFFLLVVKK